MTPSRDCAGANPWQDASVCTPGLIYKSGKLFQFTRHTVTVMRPWPQPLAWARVLGKPFLPTRPQLQLLRSPTEDCSLAKTRGPNRAVQQFMAPVPVAAY